MKIWKGFLAIFLVCIMLILLLPSPVFADDTWKGIGWIVLGLAILFGVVIAALSGFGGFWDGTFNCDLGDMILDVEGGQILVNEFNPMQNTRCLSEERIDYNIDWILTERREGRLWVGAGLTINRPRAYMGFDMSENDYGGNLLLGYSDDLWDQKWLITYLPDGKIKANVEIYYSF